MDDGRFSIGIRISFFDTGRDVVRLPLLDDGGRPVTIAIMILAYRDAGDNWNNVITNVIREDRRRDNANQHSND
jgi:hypothetical protein